MRGRVVLLLCVAFVGAAAFTAYEPRLRHSFPSVIDDWSAIAKAPDQLRGILRLGIPEAERYRPGFIMWNALQWHTLGAPESFVGPHLWGLLRFATLVLGVTLLTALVVSPRPTHGRWPDRRWLLVAGVPLGVLMAPSLMIDLTRFGPQEPLLVGCVALGVVLLVPVLDTALADEPLGPWLIAAAVMGLVFWSFGVLQKETSVCLLLLVPFLVPLLEKQRPRWALTGRRSRAAIGLLVVGMLLPFVPMVFRTLQLIAAGERVYDDAAAAKPFSERLSDQLSRTGEVLHSNLPSAIAVAAVVLLAVAAVRVGVDWLSVGFLVVAFAFAVFAAETGVVTSRYYLPAIVLTGLAVARAAVLLGPLAVTLVGAVLIGWGLFQANDARPWVQSWLEVEMAQESLVREAAAREAGGCDVGVIGLNAELVVALPVLMPLAAEPPRDCVPGERYLVVIDPGGAGTETPPDDPVLSGCAPEPEPVYSSAIGKVLRCTA